MRDVDQSEGDPKALPVEQTYTQSADSQYRRFARKEDLVREAAYMFLHNLPFAPRMRSQLVEHRVTPSDFREALFLLVWRLRETGKLPITGEREEVTSLINDIEREMKGRPLLPFNQRKHHSVVDASCFHQLYDVPLTPPKGLPSGRARMLSQPVMDVKLPESDPGRRALLDSVNDAVLRKHTQTQELNKS